MRDLSAPGRTDLTFADWEQDRLSDCNAGMKKAGGFVHRPCIVAVLRLRFFDLVFHPVALAFDGDGLGVMQQPVQNG